MSAFARIQIEVGRVIPNAPARRPIHPQRGGLRIIRPTLALLALVFLALGLRAAEVIPPAPGDHFNDYAGIVRADTARDLDARLTQFERETSNQILVVIYPHMQSDSSIEDYTVRVFQAWKAGQSKLNNGAILFIFSQDRRMRIATGYGLEGALPDALCKRILENEITPRFRNNDFDGGVRAGTLAMVAAARGEYRGTGQTARDRQRGPIVSGKSGANFIFLGLVILVAVLSRIFRGNTVYSRRGRISPWITTSMWGGGGGGWSSGGGGGGGSFSGGGGSTGGGGASGSW